MEVSNYIKMRDQMQKRFLTYDRRRSKGSMALRLMTIISMCRTFLRSGE